MINKLKQRKYLLIFGLIAFGLIFAVGYFFASKKSEPVYLSKIDQLMFDKENKSPKYVLIIPEKVKEAPKKVVQEEFDPQEVSKEYNLSTEETFVEKTNSILSRIPLLSKLQPLTGQTPLRYIDVQPFLTEKRDSLILPKISGRGQKPWAEYGYNITIHPKFRKVAIIVKGLGFEEILTTMAIKSLPPEISFSFSPYGKNVVQNIKASRTTGHETYIDLLLSSKDFLKSDTGPMSMRLTDNMEQNLERLRKSVAIDAPVGGMVINRGIADEDNKERLAQILEEIKKMGLIMVDATAENGIEVIKNPGLARQKAEIVIDESFMRDNIDKQLFEAENIAKSNGQVLIVADPKPVVLIAISEWISTFSPQPQNYEESKNAIIKKPLALVPLSMVVTE